MRIHSGHDKQRDHTVKNDRNRPFDRDVMWVTDKTAMPQEDCVQKWFSLSIQTAYFSRFFVFRKRLFFCFMASSGADASSDIKVVWRLFPSSESSCWKVAS